MWAAGPTCLAPDPPSLWLPAPGVSGEVLEVKLLVRGGGHPTPPRHQCSRRAQPAKVEVVPIAGEVAPAAGEPPSPSSVFRLGYQHLLAKSEMLFSQVVILKLARVLNFLKCQVFALSGGSRPRCRSEVGGCRWKFSPLGISIQGLNPLDSGTLSFWLTLWGSF